LISYALTYPLAETDFGAGMNEADAAMRGAEKCGIS